MRRLPAAVVAVLVVGCSAAPPAPGTDSLPETRPTTTVAADVPATTTTEAPNVELRLGSAEALAASRGVRIRIEAADVEVGHLAGAEKLDVHLPADAVLTLTYIAPNGAQTGVAWQQAVTGDNVILEQPWRDPGSTDGGIVLVWQSLGSSIEYSRQLDAAPAVTVVAPIWWYVRADGTISDQADPAYVEAAHQRGVMIWPAVAGLSADANHELLGDPERRSVAAATIADRARDIGADGVNVDIEGFREEDAAGFVSFLEELTARVHEWGGNVSYDVIPRTDSWDVTPPELAFWSTAPPRREVAAVVDYTVLMAYDQHNRYRPDGPVASPDWVLDALVYLLRYADPQHVILGVPFYGRIWDPDELETPQAMRTMSLEEVASEGTGEFDPAYGLERVTLEDGRYLWLEDSGVLAQRLRLVDEYGLAGWAAWKLGFDAPPLWEALSVGD